MSSAGQNTLGVLPRMIRRDPREPHRTASPLELFFDLVFVVAVSKASAGLFSLESSGNFGIGLAGYFMAFFAIWWAWMNFTWFATSYDTDDWFYRLLTVVQMGGALTLAAGIPRLSDPEQPDFTLVITGYVIMRVAMITQWLRAAISDPQSRTTALYYAVGIAIAQVYWVLFALFAPASMMAGLFLVGVALELMVPLLAERNQPTAWHRHHITERYGLFTIIVLGESVLASTNAVIEAAKEAAEQPELMDNLILVAVTGLVIVAAMWWIYFALPQHELITNLRTGMAWGYGHFFIFAAAAAVSAGIEVALAVETHASGLEAARAAAALCVPVALYVFMVWVLIIRPQTSGAVNIVMPAIAVLIVL
ncbi:low temperature requirement protein A, partial [Acaricomes phytoseiuli]|uniref:low temperature requirement protein A n=1 Tax=Acaricomes phytoseiuli TaxID=291968 RepID=UPI002222FF7B